MNLQTPNTDGVGGQLSPAERTAEMILASTERAAAAILKATGEAVVEVTKAATAVPTALATPAQSQVTPEELVAAFERAQANNMTGYQEPYLPFDYRVDNLVDENGNSIAPDWQPPGTTEVDVDIPDPHRPTADTIKPGESMVPGVARDDV